MVEKLNTDERRTATDGKVIIKMGALRNMMTHVLRFGANALDYSIEVMGICMGKMQGKDTLIVENAIPIAHGSREQVGFSPEDYVAFASIDEQYAEKGLFAIGWYHSHPNWGLFYSAIDIRNHIFWQKDQTPYAFGIVFDHSLMGVDGNLGFDIYRLDDYEKGETSDYIKVPYEIEVPNTLDYFKWVQKFVEDSQKKAPILIKEINEIAEPIKGELQEIPSADDDSGEAPEVDPYPKITPIVNGIQEGHSKLNDFYSGIFKQQLGNWANEVSVGAVKGTEFMKNIIGQMKEAISFGFSKVETWFEKNLDDIVEDFKNDISEYVDTRMQAQKELANDISSSSTEIGEKLNTVIEEKNLEIIKNIDEKVNSLTSGTEKLNEAASKIGDVISNSSEKIVAIGNDISSLSGEITSNIESAVSPLQADIIGKLENLNSEINSFKEGFTQMDGLFQKLQKLIMEFRNM